MKIRGHKKVREGFILLLITTLILLPRILDLEIGEAVPKSAVLTNRIKLLFYSFGLYLIFVYN
jgi:hypothetical protein